MLSASETTRRLLAEAFLLAANKVLQRYARNLRATSRSIVLRMTGKNAISFRKKTANSVRVSSLGFARDDQIILNSMLAKTR